MAKFRTIRKNGRKYVIPIKGKGTKRKITHKDRKIWAVNAVLGERKWMSMTTKKRQNRRKKPNYDSWGFQGKSPRTRDLK